MRKWMEKIPVPENLDQVVEKSLYQLKFEQKQKRRRRWAMAGSMTAAVFVVTLLFFGTHPALAGKLPFIGHLFEQVEDDVAYSGKYSEKAETLFSEEEAQKLDQGEVVKSPYIQTSSGVTVTVYEVYCNQYVLYLAVKIDCEEGFPADFNGRDKADEGHREYIMHSSSSGFGENFIGGSTEWIEGQFKDDHTFVGIYREDLGAVRDDENYELVSLPETFTYTWKIDDLFGMSSVGSEWKLHKPDGTEYVLWDEECKHYQGQWNFEMEIHKDGSRTQTIEVGETGDSGVGIDTVIKTPYEVTANLSVPEGYTASDYMLVICDSDGDILPCQGSNTSIYNIYQRNTDKIYVFVCDYYEYFNELKIYRWKGDYEEKKKEKTFAEYLSEHALVSAEVTFE